MGCAVRLTVELRATPLPDGLETATGILIRQSAAPSAGSAVFALRSDAAAGAPGGAGVSIVLQPETFTEARASDHELVVASEAYTMRFALGA